MQTTETLYWGMKFGEWVTFWGLVLGPVIAVAITLLVERRRRQHEQRTQVLRMLLATRHLPGDATYSVAINLIPVEFNDSKTVMSAWQSYIEQVRFTPTEDNKQEHQKLVFSKQTKLIFEVMRANGFKLSETDIQTSAYAAEGYIQRDNILIASQLAMPEIANILRLQTQLMTGSEPTPAASGPVIRQAE
ncbi:hypothetical protein SCH01S_14_00170 [Sphingomonas changbaiensis NBRC 104936]|uniref:DUF6680 domain-containing protein n=1 Tax=Sphingomonas changbaiensis NBRC 104936 TaxID=1219043 RepID=A0A0E9MLF8_9SPHN|nr:DUF6680 family protein [Sphingomonas changbaiensis]GAO38353.1 hypothetical protein SCH01S_14_00170 [Sphingomonas changbaiensis NBRC 104936]